MKARGNFLGGNAATIGGWYAPYIDSRENLTSEKRFCIWYDADRCASSGVLYSLASGGHPTPPRNQKLYAPSATKNVNFRKFQSEISKKMLEARWMEGIF